MYVHVPRLFFFVSLLINSILLYPAAERDPAPKKLSPRSKLIADLDSAMEKVEVAGVRATLSALEIRVNQQTVPMGKKEEQHFFLLDLAEIQCALNKKLLDDDCGKRFSALITQIGKRYPSLGYTRAVIEKAAVGLATPEGSERVRIVNRMRFGGSVSAGSSPAGASSTLGSSSMTRSGPLASAIESGKDLHKSSSSSSHNRISAAEAAAFAATAATGGSRTPTPVAFERGRGRSGIAFSRGRAASASAQSRRGGSFAPRRALQSSASMAALNESRLGKLSLAGERSPNSTTTLMSLASKQSTPGTNSSGKTSSSSSSSMSAPLLARSSSSKSDISSKHTSAESATSQSSARSDLVTVQELRLDTKETIGKNKDDKKGSSSSAQQSPSSAAGSTTASAPSSSAAVSSSSPSSSTAPFS